MFVPDGAPWLPEYLHECAAFPKGRYSDDVDSTTQALDDMSPTPAATRMRALSQLRASTNKARA